jgi:hypothetical protein
VIEGAGVGQLISKTLEEFPAFLVHAREMDVVRREQDPRQVIADCPLGSLENVKLRSFHIDLDGGRGGVAFGDQAVD